MESVCACSVKIAGLVEPLTKYRKDSDKKEVSMMRGAGRNYSRRMGIITYDGNTCAFDFTQEIGWSHCWQGNRVQNI